MSTAGMPGLDVSSRVRARVIQMAGIADVRRRVLMISGAIDTTEHDISLCVNLPEPGLWQVIKSETNLTDQTWVAIQVTTDEESSFVDDATILSRQFSTACQMILPAALQTVLSVGRYIRSFSIVLLTCSYQLDYGAMSLATGSRTITNKRQRGYLEISPFSTVLEANHTVCLLLCRDYFSASRRPTEIALRIFL